MPKRMILPIAFIIVTLVFVVKSFFGTFIDNQTEDEKLQAEYIKTAQKKKDYDIKLQTCIKQQNKYRDELDAKGQLYSLENGQKVDNSFRLLSAECKMMVIRSEKKADVQSAKQ